MCMGCCKVGYLWCTWCVHGVYMVCTYVPFQPPLRPSSIHTHHHLRLDCMPFLPQLFTSAIDLLQPSDTTQATTQPHTAAQGTTQPPSQPPSEPPSEQDRKEGNTPIATLTPSEVCRMVWGFGHAHKQFGVLLNGQLVQQAYTRVVEVLPEVTFAVCRGGTGAQGHGEQM